MTVEELIAELERLPEDLLVVLSADEEGNYFRPLAGIDANSTYRDGECSLAALTPELEAQGYTDEDVDEDGTPCVVLWP